MNVSHNGVQIPFVNATNSISVTLSPPAPPAIPPPSPPPPSPAPPAPSPSPPPTSPTGSTFPWYAYHTSTYWSNRAQGVDTGIRMVPVYVGSTIAWSYAEYVRVCKEHEVHMHAQRALSCAALLVKVPQAQHTTHPSVCVRPPFRCVHSGTEEEILSRAPRTTIRSAPDTGTRTAIVTSAGTTL